MKIYIFPVLIGGFVITILLQGIMFSSTGIQTSKLEKQITELTQKVDKLQSLTDAALTSVIKMKNETVLSDAKRASQTQVLGISDVSTDTEDLLSPSKLSETLTITSPTPTSTKSSTQKVRLKAGWTKVDVYESAKASSKILSQINAGVDYTILQKSPDWYQIKLADQSSAWVQAQFIYETN